MIVEKMIKFGIKSGENTEENLKKITNFCIDVANDRQINKENIYFDELIIQKIAMEFFLIKDFTFKDDNSYYNKEKNSYIFDENRSTYFEYQIIDFCVSDTVGEITVEFYKDPLQTQIENIVKYTLEKI